MRINWGLFVEVKYKTKVNNAPKYHFAGHSVGHRHISGHHKTAKKGNSVSKLQEMTSGFEPPNRGLQFPTFCNIDNHNRGSYH